ncbi:MAG: GGDEF domain-containing protein [Deferribacterales bacterium]
MNIKYAAQTVGEIVIEGIKFIRNKKVPLTATTLANYLKENEQFEKLFSNMSGDPEQNKELRNFLLDKIVFFQNVIAIPELSILKLEIEKDESSINLKNHIINLISIVAEYFDKAIGVQNRLKSIIDEIVIRFDSTALKVTNILEENSKILKSDIEEDKLIMNELGNFNNQIINESSIEILKQIVLTKVDMLTKEINKKIDHKSEVLNKIEKEKEDIKKEYNEYKTKEKEIIKLKREVEKYKMESVMDPLTGLYNRRFFDRKITEEIERCKRYGATFSILFLDIDDFKKINDTYGHVVGDFVLKYLAEILRSELRKSDSAFRYGGEEMVILLTETSLESALKFANRLLEMVRNTVFKYKEEELKITISVGVAEYKAGDSLDSLTNRADAAMYRAKKEGKNRVVGE